MEKKIFIRSLKRAAFLICILLLPVYIFSATCTVTTGTTHQTIRGFGGSNAWSDWSGSDCAQNSWFTAANLDMLFTTNGNGIGLSIIRMRIPPDSGSFGAAAAPVQGAAARGALVMATEWTPPAAWKSNGRVDNSDGGYLLTSHYQDYANYLRDYVNTMKNTYGVTVYALCNSNEPDYQVSYDGCTWSGAQEQDFIKNYLGPTFATAGLTTKIIVGESYANNFAITDPTLNDATAANYVSIAGVHTYGGGPSAYPNAVSKGKEYWMTEMADFNAYDASMAGMGLKVADWLYTGLVNAEYNAWIYWWLSANTSKNEGLTTTSGNPKRFFVMGNYSKFVRPGYIRIDTTAPGGNVFCSAFRDTASTSFVFIAENKNTSAQSMTFNIPGIGITSVTPWITDSSRDLASQAAVAVSANSFTFSLPAQSVVSFVGSLPAGTPTRTPTNTPYAGTPTFTATPTNTPSSILLDDMEDGNVTNNWGGNWYSYSGTGTTITPKPFTMTAGGMTGSPNYRAQIVATVADYAGMGTNLNAAETSVDLTSYISVEFWVKGNGGTYWFQFTQPSITDGDCFGVTFTAPATWTKVTVPINAASLAQRGFGAASTFTKNAITALQWASNANGALDIEIDNVQFLTSVAQTPTNTPQVTPTYTLTRTATQTYTRTNTPANTVTFTATSTPTRTMTPTLSVTPFNTFTFTATTTRSATPTYSRTPVNSLTFTRTATPTATRTVTFTPTHTQVNTFTFTPTASATASMSPSSTYTRTWTRTATRTFTPTLTVSPANTSTPTMLPTGSVTVTYTGTATPTVTNTQVNTVTFTPTATPTATRTWTLTPTNTRVNTFTFTTTSTPTRTVTLTITASPVNTFTPTAQPTGSITVSPANTATQTFTATRTVTSTFTQTSTASSTPTNTSSRTFTPTYTATRTATPSLSATPSYTQTVFQSPTDYPTGTPPSATVTPSITPTNTNTTPPTPSRTQTSTLISTQTSTMAPTSSVTQTSTLASTQTSTMLPTSSITQTSTLVSTAVSTATRTFTRTYTGTSTPSFTRTVTQTITRTSTLVSTFTATDIPTGTATQTSTAVDTQTQVETAIPTPTPTATPSTFSITDPIVYPCPYTGDGDLHVKFTLSQDCRSVNFRLYTVGFRYIVKSSVTGSLAGDAVMDIKHDRLQGLSSGTYYYIITAKKADGTEASSKIGAIIIIK